MHPSEGFSLFCQRRSRRGCATIRGWIGPVDFAATSRKPNGIACYALNLRRAEIDEFARFGRYLAIGHERRPGSGRIRFNLRENGAQDVGCAVLGAMFAGDEVPGMAAFFCRSLSRHHPNSSRSAFMCSPHQWQEDKCCGRSISLRDTRDGGRRSHASRNAPGLLPPGGSAVRNR